MPLNKSVELVTRVINEKHATLKVSAQELLKAIAGEDAALKIRAAENTLSDATSLKGMLSQNDVPSWLHSSITQTSNFVTGAWSSKDLLLNFISTQQALDKHVWQFDQSEEDAINFDAIFEHYKSQSRLPELFDEIIRILEQIKDSGHVDSVNLLSSLSKVIATIKRCKDGSYFSLNSAWDFLVNFLQNYMWGELSKLTIVGPMLEALRKTIEETNIEMFNLHTALKTETERVIGFEVKSLSNKASVSFLTYDCEGRVPTFDDVPRLTSTQA
ncbi:hypothetical protein GTP44_14600 [Duganella sp. FT50W]|uniref:Uncharacterized protein n=1 Tax=Duganella lactea TaxID=2692173 RepID=A0A6L8MMP3_9BURK|nr:hypothetical protein [Duganella lactea]MYM83182.1 hypothetical protein [Duganella lactea]